MAIINVCEKVSDCRGHDVNRLLIIQPYLTSYMQVVCNCQPWGPTDLFNPWNKVSVCKSTTVVTELLHSGHRPRVKVMFHISNIQPWNGSLEPGRPPGA